MAILNQMIDDIFMFPKPLLRKIVASILDEDIVYFNQWEKLGPSTVLRSIFFNIFRLCGWVIREFGWPRLSAYKRTPHGPKGKKVSYSMRYIDQG